MDTKKIINNSKKIYEVIRIRHKVIFEELAKLTALENTALCMGIIWLIRNKRIVQSKENDVITYSLA
ncbi:MAG: winged helix-turn-helix domain-containing protein [Prevotellaceae bacterium]|nr:winged helix-turn-helix domain-containing protein [Prevotellaceae bacterium]